MELTKEQLKILSETLNSKEDRFMFFIEMINIFKESVPKKIEVNTNEIVHVFMQSPIGQIDLSYLCDEKTGVLVQTVYNCFARGIVEKLDN